MGSEKAVRGLRDCHRGLYSRRVRAERRSVREAEVEADAGVSASDGKAPAQCHSKLQLAIQTEALAVGKGRM